MARFDDYTDKDKFLYAATCSQRSLGNLLLARLDEDQRLKKEFLIFLDEWMERICSLRSEIRNINLLRDHGEELISRLG